MLGKAAAGGYTPAAGRSPRASAGRVAAKPLGTGVFAKGRRLIEGVAPDTRIMKLKATP